MCVGCAVCEARRERRGRMGTAACTPFFIYEFNFAIRHGGLLSGGESGRSRFVNLRAPTDHFVIASVADGAVLRVLSGRSRANVAAPPTDIPPVLLVRSRASSLQLALRPLLGRLI